MEQTKGYLEVDEPFVSVILSFLTEDIEFLILFTFSHSSILRDEMSLSANCTHPRTVIILLIISYVND